MMNSNKPLVSIITVNYNNTDVTECLLKSIKLSDYDNLETIIVDNGSLTNSIDALEDLYSNVKLVKSPKNLGFAGGNNLGLKHAIGEFVFFVNNDTIFTKDLISCLHSELAYDNNLGVVSPKILFYDNPSVIQYVGSTNMNSFTVRNRHVGNGEEDRGQFDKEKATFYAHGAAMMIPRKVIEEVGEMSCEFFLYYEELDWCERIRGAGYSIHVVPAARIYHKESLTAGKSSVLKTYYMTRSRFLFARRNRKGVNLFLSLLFLMLISWPINILKLLSKKTHLKAYNSALLWNITNGRYTNKPFKI